MKEVSTCAVNGISASIIKIEVSLLGGSKMFIVGLPDSAIKESQMRIEAALKSNGLKRPNRKIIVNLAPADIKKEGAAYDLPIALAILIAAEELDTEEIEDCVVLGELSLSGNLMPIKGVLPMAVKAKEKGYKKMIVPKANAEEAAIVEGVEVYGLENIRDVLHFLSGTSTVDPTIIDHEEMQARVKLSNTYDFNEVKGQYNVKRAMEIAAAGGHNLILIGPPGSGKTMLAKRFPGILPYLTIDEAIETTKIHSVIGKVEAKKGLVLERPFRSPHHTISDVALVGGGTYPQPGEISLAHHGVLFLDELTEFKRSVLEVMRQPLEERVVNISRAKFSVEYPAAFMLIASMNPCPCGFYNHPEKDCVCHPGAVQKYLNKVSGPLLDRIDLHVEVTPVNYDDLNSNEVAESSNQVRERVIQSRNIQAQRYQTNNVFCNAQMNKSELNHYCQLNDEGKQLIKNAMERLGLSARAYDRILKVSRTIADLEASNNIQPKHISEAIGYRSLDRDDWG